MAEAVEEITSVRTLSDVTDYSQYGLETRACVIVLKDDDGTVTVTVGDVNPATGKCYVTIGDDPNVYLASGSLRNAFSHTLMQLAQVEEITQPTDVHGFKISVGDKSVCVQSVEQGSAISTGDDTVYEWVRKLDGYGGSEEEGDLGPDGIDTSERGGRIS